MTMQTNPEQWAVDLWRKACHDYGGMSIEGGWGEREAATLIQAAFAEREARLVGALEQIKHSVAQARIPGNDWKRELALIENITLAALKDRTHD